LVISGPERVPPPLEHLCLIIWSTHKSLIFRLRLWLILDGFWEAKMLKNLTFSLISGDAFQYSILLRFFIDFHMIF
jgi:hypothetical protein